MIVLSVDGSTPDDMRIWRLRLDNQPALVVLLEEDFYALLKKYDAVVPEA